MKPEDQLSSIFAALADPIRREILVRLSRGPASVGEVAAPFEVSAPAISQHLKVLERAGLVTRTVQAQWRTLSLRPEPLDEAAAWVEQQRREWNLRLDSLAEHLERMQQRDPRQGRKDRQHRQHPQHLRKPQKPRNPQNSQNSTGNSGRGHPEEEETER
ncbi:winged helix-turn-helix transcriptional regulator [Leucobacter sp. CSA1]|uniref:Winged helix-turn-helix transcriptional regulator n=1 Tax=Leucobacter chromiisoli TaxID=2796471 RepID=A0A934Q899_9MICO|nr:metalloregulator ArsR/SmtB family transcription factor [Leucobacter chromiisoli]MBK0419651.1 winged helix-turn-helix transcriptional regulator [Leucobacter chromiisoli]